MRAEIHALPWTKVATQKMLMWVIQLSAIKRKRTRHNLLVNRNFSTLRKALKCQELTVRMSNVTLFTRNLDASLRNVVPTVVTKQVSET